jgi:hypothetical protein
MYATHDANNEKPNIDIKDILKDIEVCLKKGLESKISSFLMTILCFKEHIMKF